MKLEQTNSIEKATQTSGTVVSRVVLCLLITIVPLVVFGCDLSDLEQIGAIGALGPWLTLKAGGEHDIVRIKPNPTRDTKRLRTATTSTATDSVE